MVAFFQNALGYRYLGHWQDRPDNRNVEREHIADWLKRQGHGDKIIDKVLFELNKAAALGGSKTLYDANREVYGLAPLRRESPAQMWANRTSRSG